MLRCPKCGARNPDENTTCRSCGAILGLPPVEEAPVSEMVAPEREQPVSVESAGDDLAAADDEAVEPAPPEPDEETQNLQLGRAALLGIAAAALLGVVWYFLEGVFPYSAVMVLVIGWATAFAVTFGAGRKRGRPLQWLSLGLTLATVLVVRFLRDGLANPAGFFSAFWAWFQADPLTLMFVVLGLWMAYSTPRPRPKPRRPEEPAPSEEKGEQAAAAGEAVEGADAATPAASEEDPRRKCVRCQAQIAPGEALLVPGGMRRGTLLVCPNCVAELEARFTAETEEVRMGPAVAYGVGVAVLIAVVWYLLGLYTRSPLVAILGFGAGWVLPEIIRFGAGKKRGRTLQYLAVGLTLAVIVGVNVALAATAAAGFLRSVGFHVVGLPLAAAGVPLTRPITVTPPGFLAALGRLLSDPMTDVIYLLALFQAYTGPAPRKLGGIRETEVAKSQGQ